MRLALRERKNLLTKLWPTAQRARLKTFCRITLSIAIGLVGLRASAAAETKLGFISVLTGSRASIGEDARDGANLALEELRQDATQCPLSLQFEDSQGVPAVGVKAFEKILANGIKLVVTQNSNISLPISPLANRYRVIQLAISTTSDAYSTPNDFTFRVNGSTVYEAKELAAYLSSLSSSERGCVAVLTMEDEYPRMLHKNLREELKAKNLAVCLDESFLPKETDFRSLISKALAHHAQALVCLGYQVECGTLAKQLRQSGGKTTPLVGVTPVNNREFFSAAGAGAEPSAVSYIKVNQAHPAAASFRTEYGRPPTFFAANGYDAVKLLALALKKCDCKDEPECIKTALFSIKHYVGLSGTKSFDDRFGDMQEEYEILVAKDGAFVQRQSDN